MDIQRDAAFEALDANAQQVILNAAMAYKQRKHSAPPEQIAPASGGRPGDEQMPAPIDQIALLNTTVNQTATIYNVVISAAGTRDHVSVIIGNDGSTEVRPAE
jgi:hypothetical protein